jgi:hypothetical protein
MLTIEPCSHNDFNWKMSILAAILNQSKLELGARALSSLRQYKVLRVL